MKRGLYKNVIADSGRVILAVVPTRTTPACAILHEDGDMSYVDIKYCENNYRYIGPISPIF